MTVSRRRSLRTLLSGGDRRSIANSNRARELVGAKPARVAELASLTSDDDWLVSMRALDLLEKIAHDQVDLVQPYKQAFLGPLADSDKWEIRLQIVRAVPLFHWTAAQSRRVEQILLENVAFPQTFVRAWALAQPSRKACLDALDAAGVPAAPVQRIDEVLADPQILQRGMVVEQDHPVLGRIRMPNLPFRFSDCDTSPRGVAPLMGQHNRGIATMLGYSETEIDAMIEDGVLYAEEAVGRLGAA